MNKEELNLQKRLCELSGLAYNRGIVVFSDFLNLNELNILHSTPADRLPAMFETYGGCDFCERQMVAFLPDALYYEFEYPIQAVQVTPANRRFAGNLCHRDYLGAVMNLGIERCKMGDILTDKERAILFLTAGMAAYVSEHLTRVGQTSVESRCVTFDNMDYTPEYEEIRGSVPSVRLDTVLSVAYPMSRSKLTAYIETGKVYVNGKLITNNGCRLSEKDRISVRGLGRISYEGVLFETKKNRFMIQVNKYV